MFNAIKYTQELEKAGFTRKQADASLNLLIEAMTENFATKADLKELEFATKANFKELELKMESGFQSVDLKLQMLESRLVIKLGALMATLMTVFLGGGVTLIKLLS